VLPDGLAVLRELPRRVTRSGELDIAETAEVRQKPLASQGADARYVCQLRGTVAHGAARTMVADGEAVALVANELDE